MNKPKYWFPAKSHGWGWGFPATWQGWVVLMAYGALTLGGIPIIQPDKNPVLFVLYTTVVSCALLVVCWLKGAPPRWRWGR